MQCFVTVYILGLQSIAVVIIIIILQNIKNPLEATKMLHEHVVELCRLHFIERCRFDSQVNFFSFLTFRYTL